MSGKATGMVWELDIPHNQQFVLLAMADHADHNGGHIFPSVAEIAWKTGYSERQTRRIISEMRKGKILELTKERYGKYGTNCYCILWDNAPKKALRPDKMTGGQNVTPDKMTDDKKAPPPDIQMSPDPSYDPSEEKDSVSGVTDVPPTVIVSPPSLKPELPPLEDGYLWIVSSGHGTLAHIGKSSSGPVLCKESVRHRESLDAPIGPRQPCEKCKILYSIKPMPRASPTVLKPSINQCLKDAIAINIQGIAPNEATELTGLLANRAAKVWMRKLGKANLTGDHYAKIARSIPAFVEWFRGECQGCDLPTKLITFENRYAQFVSNARKPSGDRLEAAAAEAGLDIKDMIA